MPNHWNFALCLLISTTWVIVNLVPSGKWICKTIPYKLNSQLLWRVMCVQRNYFSDGVTQFVELFIEFLLSIKNETWERSIRWRRIEKRERSIRWRRIEKRERSIRWRRIEKRERSLRQRKIQKRDHRQYYVAYIHCHKKKKYRDKRTQYKIKKDWEEKE